MIFISIFIFYIKFNYNKLMDSLENSESFESVINLFNIKSFINIEPYLKLDIFIKQISKYLKHIIISKNIENIFFMINFFDAINENTSMVIATLFIICLIYSCIVLQIFYYIILIDSLFLSFIILQDSPIKKNCRRLAKNVISLFISGNSCSIFNVILTLTLYFEISKPLSKFILKIIKIIVLLLSNYAPFLNRIYPSSKNLSFNDTDFSSRE
jgi:small-conductance mechanosensitive channel